MGILLFTAEKKNSGSPSKKNPASLYLPYREVFLMYVGEN